MKKITKLFLFFVIMVIGITTVNAKEVFKLDWKTEEYVLENIYTGISDYGVRNIEYKDGYLTTMMDSNNDWKTYINYYDVKGELITQSDILSDSIILDLIVKNDVVYALVDRGSIYLLQLSDDLEDFDNMYRFPPAYTDDLKSMLYSEIPFFGINLLSVDDEGTAYVVTIDYDMLVLSSEGELSYESYNEELLKKQFPELMELEKYYLDDVYYYTLKMNDSHIVLGGIKPNECLYTSDDCEYDSVGVITLQDNTGKELWTKEYSEYKEFINTILVGKYIVTIGIIDSEDQAPSHIVVIDQNGNIVQTIENENSYYYLTATSRGIMVTNYSEEYNNGNDGISYEDNVTISTEVYQLLYDINTTVNGKGTVEVVNNELPGTDVTFKVTPQEGYVLSEVRVTDANGKVVTFTDYTFTMPSADVTIEVIFVEEVKNPITSSSFIIIVAIGLAVAISMLAYNQKKYKWLK